MSLDGIPIHPALISVLNFILAYVKAVAEHTLVWSELAFVFLLHGQARLSCRLDGAILNLWLARSLSHMRALVEHTPCVSRDEEIPKRSI